MINYAQQQLILHDLTLQYKSFHSGVQVIYHLVQNLASQNYPPQFMVSGYWLKITELVHDGIIITSKEMYIIDWLIDNLDTQVQEASRRPFLNDALHFYKGRAIADHNELNQSYESIHRVLMEYYSHYNPNNMPQVPKPGLKAEILRQCTVKWGYHCN